MSTKILITCPEEEVSVWTGFRAPVGTGLAALKQVTLKKCPACGNSHAWSADAAYWEEELATAPVPASFWTIFKSKRRRVHNHA